MSNGNVLNEFSFLHLKIDEENLTQDLIQRCLATKLQIVIICPALISLPPSFLMTSLTSILKPEKVLGLLLDVTEGKLGDIHKTSEFFAIPLHFEPPNSLIKTFIFSASQLQAVASLHRPKSGSIIR